ncbi:MAG TPA: flavin reductase family protein [Candidatus Dormibacteraeota bacterium]|nr:flavin reductase family protein [Candidatus Dormibacteraeota bacterium]
MVDKASFRYAVGHFATSVTVMTTAAADRLHGMTVSAFSSVSLEPLLILVCVERSTVMHRLVLESRSFAVNILDERSESTARFFADNARLSAPEFREGTYRLGQTGSPILKEATGYLEATIHGTHPAGDHTIIVGEVVALQITSEEPPLIYYRSGYRQLR